MRIKMALRNNRITTACAAFLTFSTSFGFAASGTGQFIGAPEPPRRANTEPLTPEQQRVSFTLPPGFEIELVAGESEGIGKFVTVDWDLHGNMWTMTALEYPVDANESPDVAKALYSSIAKDKVLVFERPYGPGPHKPRVFAGGLAIPLGILPYKNGVYVQHGSDIVYLSDTNADGKADRREVILTGFGVQDSHLFPHQFTRVPGNWIWMAQGAFNYGKVKTIKGAEQQFDQTRMARFRYDGSDFDITSQGPCNIWGLVLTAEGEAFIQEANDYGYPVMPFHAYANYPGCSDAQWKSYAPEFPGTAPHFKMGGTGLSGLALSDAKGAWPAPYADVVYIANPITRKIQAIKMHRDGPRWRLEKLADFIQTSDEMFRPVAIKFGPDGVLYIVDWYNKIISHNEVSRNHPERDKKRGRIWRVKHRDPKPVTVPVFAKIPGNDLIAKLGGDSLAQHHLAWQAIVDRQLTNLAPQLEKIVSDNTQLTGKRIGALWALEGLRRIDAGILKPLFSEANRNLRRETVRAFGEAALPAAYVLTALESVSNDPDPEVRAEVIRTAGPLIANEPRALALCLQMGRAPLAEPTAKSTHSGKTIKVGEAYDREFERYLIRLFLEKHPNAVAEFLDSPAGQSLTLENRMLATLALEPKTSASRVAKLLPYMPRRPTEEELLRLAQFPDQPGVADALLPLLRQQPATLETLLNIRTKFDTTKLGASIIEPTRKLLSQPGNDLGLRLVSSFKLTELEDDVAQLLRTNKINPPPLITAALRALREINSGHVDTILPFTRHRQRAVRDEAILALASSKSDQAAPALLKLWPQLVTAQRRTALERLTSSKAGAHSVVHGVTSEIIDKTELDSATLDKLSAVLPGDKDLAALVQSMHALLRPALRLDGTDDSWVNSKISLDGPFTVETWIKLDPEISNSDGILGSPGALDMNFHDAKFRVWVGGGIHDAIIANKKIAADSWAHVAVTRDAAGKFRIYQNGELDTDESQAAPQIFENCRIGWTAPPKGTAGWLTEYRVWNRARSAEEIRADFDRSSEGEAKPSGLVHYFTGAGPWGALHGSAKIAKTTDFPPLLTAAEARAQAEKFATFRALAENPGDVIHGKALFTTTCMTCHNVGGQGAQIGPVLSGAGAMGTETLLRAILTPNAAMEAGYRVFRVELKDGDVLDGLLVSQDNESIVLRRQNSEDLRIPQTNVRRTGFTKLSVMPEGLLEPLKPEDVSSLFTYLRTLK
jgi:putative membrane-bound dehydrogenase-like protein